MHIRWQQAKRSARMLEFSVIVSVAALCLVSSNAVAYANYANEESYDFEVKLEELINDFGENKR